METMEQLENLLTTKLAAMARQAKRSTTPRLDEQALGRWMLDLIRPDVEAQLSDPGIPQTIIIEKFFDDPRAGDYLLSAIEEIAAELDVFHYPSVSKDDEAGAASESVIPAVIDLRGRRRKLPKNLSAIETADADARHTLAIVHAAYAAKRRVVILAKRSGYVPPQLRMPETQRVSLRPLDVAELASACENLFGTKENIGLTAEDAQWVSRIIPSDFLENAKCTDDNLVESLFRSVENRLLALAGDRPSLPLSKVSGRGEIKRWVLHIKEAFNPRHSEEMRDKMIRLVGRGAVFRAGSEDFGRVIAQSVAVELGLNFLKVAGDDFLEDPLDWIDRADDLAPCVMHIGPGTWQHLPEALRSLQSAQNPSPEQVESRDLLSLRNRLILDELGGFAPTHPVFLTTVVEDFSHLHQQFITPHTFSRQIVAGYFSDHERGRMTLHKIGLDLISPTLKNSAEKVGKLFRGRTISDVEVLHLHRRYHGTQRSLRFSDLVDLYFRGAADADTAPPKVDANVTAYHEAGHALMEIINSGGKTIPDYASILPNQTIGIPFQGVVLPEVGKQSSGVTTYKQFRNEVRISLAGRAAEEILGGPEEISNGATSDLSHATRSTTDAFANWGFSPDMANHSGSNLAVLIDTWPGPGDEGDGLKADLLSQRSRIAEMVRSFLESEYKETLRLLTDNRSLLDAIAHRLLRSPVIGRDELRRVLGKNPLA
jgi:hypothetical protein